MARTNGQIQARIVKNGGPITSLRYKSYYSSGAAGESWSAGQWLRLVDDGTVTLCTDSSGLGSGAKGIRFVALADHDSDPAKGSVFVPVQEITADTRFEMQVHHGTELSAVTTQANIGDRYDVDLVGNVQVVDLEDTTNPCVEITDIEANYNPFNTNATGVYSMVEVKILPSIIEVAAAAA